MKNKIITLCMTLITIGTLLAGCGSTGQAPTKKLQAQEANTTAVAEIITEPVTEEIRDCIRVDGQLYYSTGEVSTVPRCGNMDGTIDSSVDHAEIPQKDNQSNFGHDYGFQYGPADNIIHVYMNDQWVIFKQEKTN